MENPYSNTTLMQSLPGFSSHFETVGDTRLHYIAGGSGEPLFLLPGYPETWWAYHKVMPLLAQKYRVIVLEFRGMGLSGKPEGGYEKAQLAADVYALVQKLGYEKVFIGGHDIGAHVAFSFAANFPQATSKLVMLDTPHPAPDMYQLPMLPILGAPYLYPWWLAFNQVKELPEKLLTGRMRLLIDWFFDNLLQDQESVSDFDRGVYADAYNSADAIRASNAWYQAFPQDVEDFKTYAPLEMPVLGIGGSGYEMLQKSLAAAAPHVEMQKVAGSGHYLLAEKPVETATFIMDFLG
jgi:pimeloyl-ACP methyl ester carboxylesterase